MKRCTRCPNVTDAIDSHHIVPVAYGGKKDGDQVDICGNCHKTVHLCIENPEMPTPPNLRDLIIVGRLAKQWHAEGRLVAKDRRPSLTVALSDRDELLLAEVQRIFNTRGRAATLLAALRFAATHGRRVR
jgi:hypothetical protein